MDFFIGFWPILKTYTLAFLVLGAFAALGLLTASLEGIPVIGPWLVKFERKIQLGAMIGAAIVVAWILGNSMGIYNEAARCKLQFQAAKAAAVKTGKAARTRAMRNDAGGMCDPQDTDCRK